MAWDFETDPEYQELLDWADEFVREEVEPLDLAFPHLQFVPLNDNAPQGNRPAQGGGAPKGLVGHPPRARAGRPGLRPAQARAAQRDPRPLAVGADRVRLPGARHRQRRDHRPLRHRRTEGALPAATARRRAVLLLFDDRTTRRRRPDAVQDQRRARRRRLGDQRLEVLLLQRQNGLVPDRDGGDQPRRQRLPGHVDVPGADRHTGRQHRAQRRPVRRARRRGLTCADPLRQRAGACRRRCSAARGRRSSSRRPGSAAAASTTPCAPSACRAEGARHDVRAGAEPRDRRAAGCPTSSSCRATSPTRTRSCCSSG